MIFIEVKKLHRMSLNIKNSSGVLYSSPSLCTPLTGSDLGDGFTHFPVQEKIYLKHLSKYIHFYLFDIINIKTLFKSKKCKETMLTIEFW